jgi:WD40 repeat protein
MNTIKAYFLCLSTITFISSPLLTTSNPASLKDLTTNTLIKTILDRSLGESLSQVAPNKVPGDVREFLREALIQRYRLLLLNITHSCSSRVLVKHSNEVLSVPFSPDGQYSLTGCNDNTACLWNIQNKDKTQSYVLNSHTNRVTSVAFSPDGKFALTGSHDKTACLWDIQDKHNIKSYVLNGHTNSVTSVAFSPDGKFALTGSHDYTARLWNLTFMESLTLPMILLIIKLDQSAQDNNQILTQKHYSQTFNACNDQQLKQAIMTYFKLEPITAGLKRCVLQ